MAADEVRDARQRAEPWGVALFRSLRATKPRSAAEQAAFSKYLDERSDREDARADRTHGAKGVIPAPVWIVLFLSAGILFVFMLFFADSGERAIVQATMMGGVAILVSSLLLLLGFLDNPYHGGVGALKPDAMEGTVKLLQRGGRHRRSVSRSRVTMRARRELRSPRCPAAGRNAHLHSAASRPTYARLATRHAAGDEGDRYRNGRAGSSSGEEWASVAALPL